MKIHILSLVSTFKQQLNSLIISVQYHRHKIALKHKAWQHSSEYDEYLNIQLRRTLLKKKAPLPYHARLLIDELAQKISFDNCAILCIGTRNIAEVDYFRLKGATNVIGIDIFSENSSILVMDMHDLIFPNNHFDVIYAAHVLEHAYNIQQAVREIIRVAKSYAFIVIEAPINYVTRGADRLDFGSCENLQRLFSPYIYNSVLCQDLGRSHPLNPSGEDIARTIFTINKTFSLSIPSPIF